MTALLTRPGQPTLTRTARSTFRADGVPTAPMSLATVRQIERCYNTTSDVWLTFDDRFRTRADLESILATLRRNNVRGRFFAMGGWARQDPGAITRIKAAGHLVQNHTEYHPPLGTVTRKQLLREIDRGPTPNASPKLLRPPYGSGAYTARLADLAATRGYKLCRWTVDTLDWDATPAWRIVEKVAYGDTTTPPIAAGGNVLMHMDGEHTPEALQAVIDTVRGKGLSLDRLR